MGGEADGQAASERQESLQHVAELYVSVENKQPTKYNTYLCRAARSGLALLNGQEVEEGMIARFIRSFVKRMMVPSGKGTAPEEGLDDLRIRIRATQRDPTPRYHI